jgi:hypothetical protein
MCVFILQDAKKSVAGSETSQQPTFSNLTSGRICFVAASIAVIQAPAVSWLSR